MRLLVKILASYTIVIIIFDAIFSPTLVGESFTATDVIAGTVLNLQHLPS